MNPSLIIQNAAQIVTVDDAYASAENPLGVIADGALAAEGGKIAWLGKSAELNPADYPAALVIDAAGKILLPGLIDSHTHPVFAGDRADEFEMRLRGETYLEIAAKGGGIAKTVTATRNASEDELYELAKLRLVTMMLYGVTTVEAKSGYGLDWDSEFKSLQVLNRLKRDLLLDIRITYMGAHDIPPEYKDRTDDYVELLCNEQLPDVAKLGLAEFCDVFCEKGYFSVAQSRKILQTAKDLGFKLKIHAEEFCDLGGATLAGEMNAMSADHLLHVSDEGIAALKSGGVVATLLPGTAFFLRLNHYAPAKKLLAAGVPVALATDFNPGSCMTENLQLIMTLGCLQMGMPPADVIRAVTLNGAKALGLAQDRGSLAIGKRADLGIYQARSYNELLYHYGINHLSSLLIAGQKIF